MNGGDDEKVEVSDGDSWSGRERERIELEPRVSLR